uniref:Peptidase S1 domain-containing protein n=1 Tax=Megaselia scalaris TaxID=36166 RepID=T1GVQ4_MEGSC
SIISNEHVLTAAHCLKGQKKSRLSILAGVTNLNQKSGSRHNVKSFAIHRDYKELVRNDIALMKVSPPFQFDGKAIGPIRYNITRKIGGGESVMLTGWGSISPSTLGPLPKDLQYLKLKTITNNECNRLVLNVSKTEVCAFRSPFSGACAGDSGGPLALEDQSLLVGVVSYGTLICAVGLPDVYTRVSVLSGWIEETMRKL